MTGVIVGDRREIAGFVFKGKPKDFGNIGGNEEIVQSVSMQVAKGLLHNCSNFTIKNGIITKLGKQSLNDLQMYSINGTPVDNRIDLVSKVVQRKDGSDKAEIIGFDVLSHYDGTTNRYRYQDVVTLTGWFKPGNFNVKFTGEGKAFISGKPHVMKLDELPTYEVEAASKRAHSRKKQAVENPAVNNREGSINSRKLDRVQQNSLDIFSILGKIAEANGVIIYLQADNKYSNTTTNTQKTSSDFYPIENCLVGNPYPEFSADKMKVGILFRKPGLVNIPELGRVYSFTYSNRTIIRNGKNYIRTLGVGVSAEKEAELLAYFGKCGGELHISKLDDVEVIKAVEAINGNTGLKYYKLDLSKIKVLSNKTAEEAEKSVAEIGDTVQTIQWHKGRVKAIKAAFKSLSPAAYTSGKKIASMFAHYNAEALQILTDNGIDIYSGAYVAKDDLSKDDIKEGTDSKDAPISIKYEVTGFHFNNLTGDDLVQGNAKAMKNELYKQQLEKYGRVGDFVLNHPQEALEAIDESDKIVRANTRIVWMHNAAMLQKTKFTSIYKGNTDWVEVPSRAQNAKKYAYNGLPLTMLVQGVTVG